MGTTSYGGKGSKGGAANGDRLVGTTSFRRGQCTMASCQNPHIPRLTWMAPTQVPYGLKTALRTKEEARQQPRWPHTTWKGHHQM